MDHQPIPGSKLDRRLAADIDSSFLDGPLGRLRPFHLDVQARRAGFAAFGAVRCVDTAFAEHGYFDRLEKFHLADDAVAAGVVALAARVGTVAELTENDGWKGLMWKILEGGGSEHTISSFKDLGIRDSLQCVSLVNQRMPTSLLYSSYAHYRAQTQFLVSQTRR